MPALLYVALGGAIGASARYLFATWLASFDAVANAEVPWATFAINVCGSFLLGIFVVYSDIKFSQHHLDEQLKLFFQFGVLAAFTTFSTFSLELVQLYNLGQMKAFALYSIGSIIAGFLALLGAMAITNKLLV